MFHNIFRVLMFGLLMLTALKFYQSSVRDEFGKVDTKAVYQLIECVTGTVVWGILWATYTVVS